MNWFDFRPNISELRRLSYGYKCRGYMVSDRRTVTGSMNRRAMEVK